MPVAVIDSFNNFRLLPDDISIISPGTNATLTFQAGIGINFIAHPETDTIEIYNTGQGLAALDDVLQIGEPAVSTRSMKLSALTVNGGTGLKITWTGGTSGAVPTNPTISNGGAGYFVNDLVTISGGGSNSVFSVTSVDTTGGITSLTRTVPGTGYYTTGTDVPTVNVVRARIVADLDYDLVLKATGTGTVYIDSDQALRIPVGDTAVRPDGLTGQIRFNTSTNQFEGYNSIAWTSLGGVRDVANGTYILPELTPGSNDQTLFFYAGGVQVGAFNTTGLTIEDNRVLAFREAVANGTNVIKIKAPASIPGDYTLTLPPALGANGSLLGLTTSGQLEFVVPDAFGGSAIYVSTTRGDDSYDGISKPVKTLKRALQIASSLVYNSNGTVNGTKIAINVAAGEYYEDNPLIVPDNVSVKGASLRACNLRPLNANKDFLRIRNASYFSEFTYQP